MVHTRILRGLSRLLKRIIRPILGISYQSCTVLISCEALLLLSRTTISLVLESYFFIPIFLIAYGSRFRCSVLVASTIQTPIVLGMVKSSNRACLISFVSSSSQSYLITQSQLSLLSSLTSGNRLTHDAIVFVNLLRFISVITRS